MPKDIGNLWKSGNKIQDVVQNLIGPMKNRCELVLQKMGIEFCIKIFTFNKVVYKL